jgi:hypothetical protein
MRVCRFAAIVLCRTAAPGTLPSGTKPLACRKVLRASMPTAAADCLPPCLRTLIASCAVGRITGTSRRLLAHKAAAAAVSFAQHRLAPADRARALVRSARRLLRRRHRCSGGASGDQYDECCDRERRGCSFAEFYVHHTAAWRIGKGSVHDVSIETRLRRHPTKPAEKPLSCLYTYMPADRSVGYLRYRGVLCQ